LRDAPIPLKRPYHKKIYFGVTSHLISNVLTIHGPAGFRSVSCAPILALAEAAGVFGPRPETSNRRSHLRRRRMPNLTDVEQPKSFVQPCLLQRV
jgi:hypothetical protein